MLLALTKDRRRLLRGGRGVVLRAAAAIEGETLRNPNAHGGGRVTHRTQTIRERSPGTPDCSSYSSRSSLPLSYIQFA